MSFDVLKSLKTFTGRSLSVVAVFSSLTTVDFVEDGVMANSDSNCSLFNRPIVDFSSLNVVRASSAVRAMYGSSLLILLRCLILLIWLLIWSDVIEIMTL